MKNKTSKPNLAVSVLFAAVPLAFLVGLWLGFRLWGDPSAQVAARDSQNPTRIDIPIYEDDPVMGPEDAVVTIIEFSDYECPYCRSYHWDTFGQIIATYGDQVRYVFKDLPLTSLHPNAVPAAIAAHCANEQGAFWEFHDLLFTMELGLNQEAYLSYADRLGLDTAAFSTCLEDGRYAETVMLDTNILYENNVPLSTPTFFINGQYLAGAQPFASFSQLIDAELASD